MRRMGGRGRPGFQAGVTHGSLRGETMFLAFKSCLIPCILPKEQRVTRKAKGQGGSRIALRERMLNFYFWFCYQ